MRPPTTGRGRDHHGGKAGDAIIRPSRPGPAACTRMVTRSGIMIPAAAP